MLVYESNTEIPFLYSQRFQAFDMLHRPGGRSARLNFPDTMSSKDRITRIQEHSSNSPERSLSDSARRPPLSSVENRNEKLSTGLKRKSNRYSPIFIREKKT